MPIIAEPDANGCQIDIQMPLYSVVLSPCCSIGEKTISLTPLIQVDKNYFKNPYFADDLTRINRQMEPQQAMPPEGWEKLAPEIRVERLAEGINYALLQVFVYAGNDLFTSYEVRDGNKTNCYMIDFRSMYRLNCKNILSATNAPLGSKCLQLSIQTRSELRDKLAYYYSRVPKEDLVV